MGAYKEYAAYLQQIIFSSTAFPINLQMFKRKWIENKKLADINKQKLDLKPASARILR